MMKLSQLLKTLLVLLLCESSGCCSWRASSRLPRDSFERYVIVDLGLTPDCPLPRTTPSEARAIIAGDSVRVWLRAVSSTNVRAPAVTTGDTVRLRIVDSFGNPSNDAVVTPREVVITDTGFAAQEIFIRAKSAFGHFRIRADYADKQTVAVSYSPWVIVR
jgi:hypothetical protein